MAIDIAPPQSLAGGVKDAPDPLRAVTAVPRARGDEDVLPPKRFPLERRAHRFAACVLIALSFRAIRDAGTPPPVRPWSLSARHASRQIHRQ